MTCVKKLLGSFLGSILFEPDDVNWRKFCRRYSSSYTVSSSSSTNSHRLGSAGCCFFFGTSDPVLFFSKGAVTHSRRGRLAMGSCAQNFSASNLAKSKQFNLSALRQTDLNLI